MSHSTLNLCAFRKVFSDTDSSFQFTYAFLCKRTVKNTLHDKNVIKVNITCKILKHYCIGTWKKRYNFIYWLLSICFSSANNLSGGMKRKLQVGCALIGGSKVTKTHKDYTHFHSKLRRLLVVFLLFRFILLLFPFFFSVCFLFLLCSVFFFLFSVFFSVLFYRT